MTDELRTLADAAVDGRLTPEQMARLEELVLSSAEARRFYSEYAHLNASLRWASVSSDPAPAAPRRPRTGVLVGLAAALLLAVALLAWPRGPQVVATLTETKGCKWESGSLPTEAGAKLPAGRLRLAEGLAKLTFASGAEVTLEGPADIELLTPMKCVLRQGQLVASVPPAAKGFVVDTPGSQVTDYGTEFGVTVHDATTADVQVFSGHVDVLHRPTGRTRTLLTGNNSRFTPDAITPFNPNAEPSEDAAAKPVGRVIQISTATGRGRDAFIQPIEPPPDRSSDTLLLVKSSLPKAPEWHRKAYLGFDLEDIDPTKVTTAELTVTFAPTGMGFAAQMPDATFSLYGLTDQTLDDWDEEGLCWANAPANRSGGNDLDRGRVLKLGTFQIPQGEGAGSRTVGGQPLVDFLRADTNKLATLVLVRDTCEAASSGLVHGFASRRHPTLPPPTLRLTVQPAR